MVVPLRYQATRIAWAAALAALVAGIPLGLWALVGNPFPSSIPTADAVVTALTTGDVADATLWKLLAFVCWVAWAQLVVAVVVEVVAVARMRPTPKIPLARSMQSLAGVAVAAIVAGQLGQTTRESTGPLLISVQSEIAGQGEATGEPVHVVERGDTLWEISEGRLGDPFRWPELHRVNEGVEQPDGDRLEDPDHIHPGWHITIPESAPPAIDPPAGAGDTEPDASPASPNVEPDASPASPNVEELPTVDDGDPVEAAERAEREAEAAEAQAAEVLRRLEAASPEARGTIAEDTEDDIPPPLPDAGQGGDAPGGDTPPDDEHPSEARLEPEDLDPSEESGSARATRLPAPATWPDALRTGPPGAAVVHIGMGETELELPAPISMLGGGGILAAGVVWTLERLRRSRERRREPGDDVALPDDAARESEQRLRQRADASVLEWLDITLRVFASRLAARPRSAPPVYGVNVGSRELSMLFGAPDPDAVEGFVVEDDGFSWMTERPSDLTTLVAEAGQAPPPFPALVTLGHTSVSQVLVNLQAARLVAVRGPGLVTHETLFSMALELGTGVWADAVSVVAVGFGHDLVDLAGVVVVDALDDALAVLDHDTTGRPTVLLCGGHHPERDVHELVTRSGDDTRPQVTAVMAGEVPAAEWVLEVTSETVRWLPLGVELARHRIDPAVRRGLEGLVHHTSPVAVVRAAPDPYDDTDASTSAARNAAALVRVLGPVDVEGGQAPLPRGKALELVAYLATHQRGADADRLLDALWGMPAAGAATLHSVVSTARRCLGTDHAGAPLLPPADAAGLYRLSPAVDTDLAQFTRHVTAAERYGDGPTAAAHLRHALELVRGVPFTVAGGEYVWVHAEALGSSVVADVSDAAHHLATLYLEAGDPKGAWWATAQGLLASPGNEALHRDRMLAADLAGDPDGVEQVMEELCRAIDIDPDEIDDLLHPKTLALYARLSRRRSILAAGP